MASQNSANKDRPQQARPPLPASPVPVEQEMPPSRSIEQGYTALSIVDGMAVDSARPVVSDQCLSTASSSFDPARCNSLVTGCNLQDIVMLGAFPPLTP